MKKKRLIISLSIVGVLVILSFCMMIVSTKKRYDYRNNSRIFETIEDLDFIDEYVVEENINLDNNILEEYVSESKTVSIEYNENEINIFAYVFTDIEHCLEYAQKVSGNNYKKTYSGGNIARHYYKHTSFLNMAQTEKLLVFSNEKAYVITAKISDKKFNEFITYFMGQLPIKVEMVY